MFPTKKFFFHFLTENDPSIHEKCQKIILSGYLSLNTEKTDFSINAHFQYFFLSVATVAKQFMLETNVYSTKVEFFPKGQNGTQFFSVACTTEK